MDYQEQEAHSNAQLVAVHAWGSIVRIKSGCEPDEEDIQDINQLVIALSGDRDLLVWFENQMKGMVPAHDSYPGLWARAIQRSPFKSAIGSDPIVLLTEAIEALEEVLTQRSDRLSELDAWLKQFTRAFLGGRPIHFACGMRAS